MLANEITDNGTHHENNLKCCWNAAVLVAVHLCPSHYSSDGLIGVLPTFVDARCSCQGITMQKMLPEGVH